MHFSSKLHNYIANLSLKVKLYLICWLVAGVLFSTTSVIGLNAVLRVQRDLLYRSISADLASTAGTVSDYMQDITNLTDLMIADEYLQTTLGNIYYSTDSEGRQEDTAAVKTHLENYYSLYSSRLIRFMSLYTSHSAIHTDLFLAGLVPQDIREDMIENAVASEGKLYWCTDYADQYGLLVSREIRESRNLTLNNLGVVVLSVDFSSIVERATNYSGQYAACSYLVYDDGNLIFRTDDLDDTDLTNFSPTSDDGYDIIKLDGRKFFAVSGSIPDFDWNYVCLMSYDDIFRTLSNTYLYYAVSLIIVLIAAIFIMKILVDSIVVHLTRLIEKMKQYHGNIQGLTIPDPRYADRTDELGVLHREFDSMATEIDSLIHENYESELLRRDAQLQALEMQINPHFLYNTLETINWRAKAIGEKNISRMVQALGMLMRKSLSQSENNTLADEIEILQHFMVITNLRFEDRLVYTCDVPSGLLDAQLPRMTLQPLVENAVRYSLDDIYGTSEVSVSACLDGGVLDIRIENSGSQFEEDLLMKLEQQTIRPRGFGIGILNINKRLELFFGPEYGLRFFNRDEEHAVVEIRVPYLHSGKAQSDGSV